MYRITIKGINGSSVTDSAARKGEMLDRVRYAMDSRYIAEVIVTKTNPPEQRWEKCDHKCEPSYDSLHPEAQHFLDCPVWAHNA